MSIEYFLCPSCKESERIVGGELKCFKCSWNTRKALPAFRKLTRNEEREEREKKVKEMTTRLISESPPKIEWSESDIPPGGNNPCWAWTDSPTNTLTVPTNTFNLHRRQFTDTVAHETGHLSPKRAMNWEDFLAKCQKHNLSWKQLQDWVEEHPEEAGHLVNGFPNNCVPDEFNKESFEGHDTWSYTDGRGIEITFDSSSNWEAGTGHGWEWYGEYQNYKGILYSYHQRWIDDKSQFNKLEEGVFDYPTFSNGWFRNNEATKGWSKEVVMKSKQNIELYGEDFMKDEDDDLYGMIRKI